MIEINLLPGAQRRKRTPSFDFTRNISFAGVTDRFKDKYLLGGVGAAIVGLGAIAFMYTTQAKAAGALDTRERAAAADSARFAAVLKARASAETARDSVYQQVAIIKAIDDSRYTWPHLLEEINLAVPQYTWLTSVLQTSAITSGATTQTDTSAAGKAKADSARKALVKSSASANAAKRARADSLFSGAANTLTFRIVGQTVDVQALTQFMKNLEASPFIKNVQLTRSDLVTADNKEVTEFQLEAQSEIPPQHLLQTVPLSIAVH